MFVSDYQSRVELNFFQDFFVTADSFNQWIKDSVLGKDTTIPDNFLVNFYYAFLREYRNQNIYEQAFFLQDLTSAFINRKRRLEILYEIWSSDNENDPYEMIRDNRYEKRDYRRSDRTLEERDSQNTTNLGRQQSQKSNDFTKNRAENQSAGSDSTDVKSKNLELEISNNNQIQGKLALNDLVAHDEADLESKENYATGGSIGENIRKDSTLNLTGNKSKNSSINDNVSTTNDKLTSNQIENLKGKNKSNSQTDGRDFNKSFNQNKADLIKKFVSTDLTEGFQEFTRAKDFSNLFSKMNAGTYSWYGYVETKWEDVPLVDASEEEIPLQTILTKTDIGYINDANAVSITDKLIKVNPKLTKNDFFVSNIYPNNSNAYVVGRGQYKGYFEINYLLVPTTRGGQ